jgi:hypothetical protein
MGEYKLMNGEVVVFRYEGEGAMGPSGIKIREKDSDSLIGELPKFDYKYILSFKQINDTLLEVSLLDTAVFKGHVTDVLVSLNKRKEREE